MEWEQYLETMTPLVTACTAWVVNSLLRGAVLKGTLPRRAASKLARYMVMALLAALYVVLLRERPDAETWHATLVVWLRHVFLATGWFELLKKTQAKHRG